MKFIRDFESNHFGKTCFVWVRCCLVRFWFLRGERREYPNCWDFWMCFVFMLFVGLIGNSKREMMGCIWKASWNWTFSCWVLHLGAFNFIIIASYWFCVYVFVSACRSWCKCLGNTLFCQSRSIDAQQSDIRMIWPQRPEVNNLYIASVFLLEFVHFYLEIIP